jgi:hypothetical protein
VADDSTAKSCSTDSRAPHSRADDIAADPLVAEHITAYRCIGCGKIEAPQPCIGICQDRRMEIVDGRDFDTAAAAGVATRCDLAEVTTLLRRLAWTTPRAGEWERSYQALQAQARRLVGHGVRSDERQE